MASGDGPRGMDEGGAADVAPIAEEGSLIRGFIFWVKIWNSLISEGLGFFEKFLEI